LKAVKFKILKFGTHLFGNRNVTFNTPDGFYGFVEITALSLRLILMLSCNFRRLGVSHVYLFPQRRHFWRSIHVRHSYSNCEQFDWKGSTL